jgi:hypothetical protein
MDGAAMRSQCREKVTGGFNTEGTEFAEKRRRGAAWLAGGQPRVIFGFAIERGKIVSIDLVADVERLQKSELKLLED